MLRKILILKDKTTLYEREYGKSLPEETLHPLIESLKDYLRNFVVDLVDFMHIINFNLCYATTREFNLLFIMIIDPTDKEESVRTEIEFIRHNFLEKFRTALVQGITVPAVYRDIEKDIKVSKSELRPKISLVGFSGVGKTTITKLIKEEELPTRHIPTITGYISEITVGDFDMYLWDLAGQVRYANVWAQFMRGSDAIILITDSTEQNVHESRFFVELSRKEAPYARFTVVANKQDLPGALSIERISEILDCGLYGYKTTPLVAIDVNNRIPVVKLLAATAATTAKTLSEFQTLDDRAEGIQEAKLAIEKGYLKEASKVMDEVAQLSEKKGDPEGAQLYASYAAYLRDQSQTIEEKMKLIYQEIQERIQL
jgi:small GTP-binding protein